MKSRIARGKGETHEDFGMYSYDETLKKIIFRQFHSEGFVNAHWQPPGKAFEVYSETRVFRVK